MLEPVMRGSRNRWHGEQEDHRLTAHFNQVLTELCEREPSGLTHAQRIARGHQVQRLRRYRDAARFPRNSGATGRRRTPIFRDGSGAWCAMGQLIVESGSEALAREVADLRNLATIHALADDLRLHDWLKANGLTLEEAARIQPSYEIAAKPPADCFCALSTEAKPVVVEVQSTDGSVAEGVVVDGLGGSFEANQPVALSRWGSMSSWGLSKGDRVLGSLVPGETSLDAGTIRVIDAEGQVRCDENPAIVNQPYCRMDLSVPLDVAIEALQSSDCKAYLGQVDARWTKDCGGGRCSAGPEAPWTGSAVSLVLVSLGIRAWHKARAR